MGPLIFELSKTLFTMFLFLVAMFPAFSSPISLGGVLVLISFSLVAQLSMLFGGWYAYILFLIYIGGLLVLFIYVCMVSSNYSLSMSLPLVVLLSLGALGLGYASKMAWLGKTLGCSSWECGSTLSLGLFIGLVILLLVAFLAVARIVSGDGHRSSGAIGVSVTK